MGVQIEKIVLHRMEEADPVGMYYCCQGEEEEEEAAAVGENSEM